MLKNISLFLLLLSVQVCSAQDLTPRKYFQALLYDQNWVQLSSFQLKFVSDSGDTSATGMIIPNSLSYIPVLKSRKVEIILEFNNYNFSIAEIDTDFLSLRFKIDTSGATNNCFKVEKAMGDAVEFFLRGECDTMFKNYLWINNLWYNSIPFRCGASLTYPRDPIEIPFGTPAIFENADDWKLKSPKQ